MNSAEKSNRTEVTTSLAEAPLAAVLLYGLTLDDDDPALGVLLGARRELGLLATLAESTPSGIDYNLADFVPVLEGIGRRIEVAIELLTRAKRASTADEPQATKPLDPIGGADEQG